MRLIHALAALALAAAAPAFAQTTTTTTTTTTMSVNPMSEITRVFGEVTAISATQISVRGDDGQTKSFPLAPNWVFVVGHVIQASDIKPGDFVATSNTNVDANSGRSVELRVFPPGMHMGEGSYPMGGPNTTMTNATVAEVTDVADGRVLTVRYPGGERHITLPSSVTVIGQTVGDKATLAVGAHVRAIARPDANGVVSVFYVTASPEAPRPH